MGAKARHEGAMVPAAKLLVGGATGAAPALAEVRHKGIPLPQLPDALEQLLVDEFAARRRPGAGSV
jgi:ferredoxin-nitrite reductase